ncbi:MAG: hypothetical protein HY021_06955 [Burkholderiales bacterium]|nr:hypothetical protein [Burkholderiales bacterium]
MTRGWLLGGLLLILVGMGAGVVLARGAVARAAALRSLEARLEAITRPEGRTELDCQTLLQANPIVLLALGQSNAASHGEPGPSPSVTLIDERQCFTSGDPLPGSTGSGGSIWSRLPDRLRAQGVTRPVLLSVLAVDATTIADWTSGPLAALLRRRIAALAARQAMPTLILWQQGEADAMLNTPSASYFTGLQALDRQLTEAGVRAPVVMARSTVCRSAPNAAIADAQNRAISDRFVGGPDTDALVDPALRRDGCHFSTAGLNAAADLWAVTLKPLLVRLNS